MARPLSIPAVALVVAVAVCLAAGGCAPEPLTPVPLDIAGTRPGLDFRPLATVLKAVVTADGLVRKQALREQAETLDKQLKLLAVTGPESTPLLLPTDGHYFAYWYNARAAWSLKLLLIEDCPSQVRDAHRFEERPFPLDGRLMTLADIDRELAEDDDWRTLVAAPCVLLNRARLPAKPYTSDDIRERIVQGFRAFVDDERRFVLDVERQSVRVPPVLWRMRGRLIETYEETYGTRGATLLAALMPYLRGSSARRVRDAVGYRVVSAEGPWKTAFAKHE